MAGAGCALVAFGGTGIDAGVTRLLQDPRVAGVTLYRSLNVADAAQTRRLTADLVAAAGRPLLVAVDQEGGQLLGAGPDPTPFAGNMALGAAGDADLTLAVAGAIGRELRALGINVDYAPVVDVASRPGNPSLGIRSFGEDPEAVSTHARSFVAGLQQQGVAATLKHFPGKGEAAVDPHDRLPVLDLGLDRLDRVEFAPFRAGIEAGAKLVMVGHYGLPKVTGDPDLPTSVAPAVLGGLLRQRLGFGGVIVTDALDMGGFGALAAEAPLAAGADLLLYGPRQTGRLPAPPAAPSPRVAQLLDWMAGFPVPDPAVVGCAEHQRLAARLATRSITLVRDGSGLIPLRPGGDARILAIMPRPADLTPADTSSLVLPGLARALRRHHRGTSELVVGQDPSPGEIAGAVRQAVEHDIVVVGTIDASVAQAALVTSLIDSGVPVVAAALRTPYDLARYPAATTYLCSYGILPPTMEALAAALFGAAIDGRLPAAIPGLYAVGHGMRKEERA